MANDTFIYVAAYPDEMAARADYEAVKDLHASGLVGSYDAAVESTVVIAPTAGGVLVRAGQPYRSRLTPRTLGRPNSRG